MAINTLATLADHEPQLIAESRFTLQEVGVMRNLVSRETLGRGQGGDVNIPKFATLTAYALTEGVDL